MDIDIDFANRNQILDLIKHIPASIIDENKNYKKHNTGIYFQNIPVNPLTKSASIDYKEAENRGYFKLDFLNVHLYTYIKNNDELIKLMHQEPNWSKLNDKTFFEKLIHINAHFHTYIKMPEPIDNVEKMAMFLSIIRPAKRHLIGLPWNKISETVWDKNNSDGYAFKRSHATSYAYLVIVNMNLLEQNQTDLEDLTN